MVGAGVALTGLGTWKRETIGKRKAELAEEVLAAFYEARDIINAARSPAIYVGEGKTRERNGAETEQESRQLDIYFATIERLNNRREFFSQIHAQRYRAQAIFGIDSATPFETLFRIRTEIAVAADMLMTYHKAGDVGSLPDNRRDWRATIAQSLENDPIAARLDKMVAHIEAICRSAIAASVR
jgi:hypothetical protein